MYIFLSAGRMNYIIILIINISIEFRITFFTINEVVIFSFLLNKSHVIDCSVLLPQAVLIKKTRKL